jgi:hypothetical protein
MNPPPRQADALLARARRLLSDHRTRAKRDGGALDYGLAEWRRLLSGSPCCARRGHPHQPSPRRRPSRTRGRRQRSFGGCWQRWTQLTWR